MARIIDNYHCNWEGQTMYIILFDNGWQKWLLGSKEMTNMLPTTKNNICVTTI